MFFMEHSVHSHRRANVPSTPTQHDYNSAHTLTVTDFCFRRPVCRPSVCLSRIRSRKLSEMSAKFCRLYVGNRDQMSDFAPEVAKHSTATISGVCKPTVSLR